MVRVVFFGSMFGAIVTGCAIASAPETETEAAESVDPEPQRIVRSCTVGAVITWETGTVCPNQTKKKCAAVVTRCRAVAGGYERTTRSRGCTC